VRQVGYLHRLYRDARTIEHKIPVLTVNTALINFTFKMPILFLFCIGFTPYNVQITSAYIR
jgi:hypothetical protein